MDFARYVERVANRLSDHYGIHPEDVVQLMDYYDADIIARHAKGISVNITAKTLNDRFNAIVAAAPVLANPIASPWAFAIMGVGVGGLLYAAFKGVGSSAPVLPTTSCTNWEIPTAAEVAAIGARATELLNRGDPVGTVYPPETIGGKLYRFNVEIHGPNQFNPANHRGVGARVCRG